MVKKIDYLCKRFETIRDLSEEIGYYVQIIKIVYENGTNDEYSCLIPLINILRHKTVHLTDKSDAFYSQLYKISDKIL